MATKPTLANARFGETVGEVVSGTLVAPASGVRDTGFVNGSLAAPGQVSNMLHEFYLWAKYVNDGALDGNVTISGDLTVGGALEVGADAQFDEDVSVDGNLDVGGVLGVDGAATITGNTTIGGWQSSDQNYHTTAQFLKIPASAARNPAADHALNAGASWWVTTGSANPIIYPIDLPTGAVITGITVFANKTSGIDMRVRLYRVTSTFTEDTMSLTPGSTTASGDVVIAGGAYSVVTDATSSYTVVVYPNTVFGGGDKVGTVVVSWTYPHP